MLKVLLLIDVQYGAIHALKNLSLDVEQGQAS